MLVNLTETTLATAGGKGANLGKLVAAGFPVPDGFVVTADMYQWIVKDLHIDTIFAENGADAVRSTIEAQDIPEGLQFEIAERLMEWGPGVPVAVRSSATAEDLPEASFAGQQDTFLGVVGVDAVLKSVRRCWGSLWTQRAVDYRERNGFDHRNVAIAVVVQRLVDADSAGVLFTRNPITGADECVINASWGLGESVVSGAVTPDQYRATTTSILERAVGSKHTRIDRDGTYTRIRTVPTTDQKRLCLNDDQILELTHLATAVEKHFKQPMDLEWAYQNGKLWLLQARPITTMSAIPTTVDIPTRTISGRKINSASRAFYVDLIEHYPGPTPLDLAAIIPMHQQLQRCMATIGIISTPISELLRLDNDGTVTAGYPDVRFTWRIARLLHYRAPDPTNWIDVETSFRDQLAELLPPDIAALSHPQLFDLLGSILELVNDIARTRFLDYVGPAQLRGIKLNAYLKMTGCKSLDAYSLLGDLDYITAIIDRELRYLAALDQQTSTYSRARQRFLDNYGARTTKLYLPFSHRSWREDPTALEATLDAIRRTPEKSSTVMSHGKLIEQVSSKLPRLIRRRFLRSVSSWRAGHVAREASVYLIEEMYLAARQITDEMARRLLGLGALTTTKHIAYLTLDEIRTVLMENNDAAMMRKLVEVRANTRTRAAAKWWQSLPTRQDADLAGTAGSPGIASGPARIIAGPSDFSQLQPGDVLVCKYTDPSWTPLFGLAAAVIAETGGRLSHAAIVAREYGIPAIMGAANATNVLTNGQLVTVNGTAGTFAIIPDGD
ncbi:PEP/pyruvate-binding domain-containing protein [Trueperella pyogenes]|uniref:PEP/pyruvate-binding domain-containing protein n=1 Tax=Trueperella pyogenes TaxID=1661 RepID=UPI00324EF449